LDADVCESWTVKRLRGSPGEGENKQKKGVIGSKKSAGMKDCDNESVSREISVSGTHGTSVDYDLKTRGGFGSSKKNRNVFPKVVLLSYVVSVEGPV